MYLIRFENSHYARRSDVVKFALIHGVVLNEQSKSLESNGT